MIVRHRNKEQLQLPAAAFGLLADSGTTQGTLGANRLSLETGLARCHLEHAQRGSAWG